MKFAVCPAVMETEVAPGVAGAMDNAGLAVAAMLMTCGEFAASSVMVIAADRAPTASGAKATPMVQLALAV